MLQNPKFLEKITITVAANITYKGFTYSTPLIVEYKHTGLQYHLKNKFTDSKEIFEEWKAQGKKVVVKEGYYYISRLAIPTINAKGEKCIWYINNSGDSYTINKVSKYGKKIHSMLSNNIVPLTFN